MSDSFFDMPAGYNDADMDMASLEDLGNRACKRYRALGYPKSRDLLTRIENGETVESPRYAKDTNTHYIVLVKMTDADEVGPILSYSLDGETWHDSAKAARLSA